MPELQELAGVLAAFEPEVPRVDQGADWLVETLRGGGKVLSCGNGGSAADALHLAEELTGRYRANRKALAAVCLAADPTALTCISNDFGFERVFSRQVEALARPGDLLVGFSTSGKSANVLEALRAARGAGARSILLAGGDGGTCGDAADLAILVPSSSGARIQEVHTVILHHWLERVEAERW